MSKAPFSDTVLVGQVQNKKRKKSRTGKHDDARSVRKRRSRKTKESESADEIRESPMGCNVDTIVIMPVNVSTSFIYWEMTEKLLKGGRKGMSAASSQLMLKIFATDRKREICSLPVRERIGKHYITCRDPFTMLVAEIGMLRGKRFTGLLRSRPMNVNPSLEHEEGGELWMRKIRGSHTIVSTPAGESAQKSSALRTLIMHYYHSAGAARLDVLSSASLVRTP